MRARVIIPPEPIVLPSDIAGGHGGDDAGVAAMIAAVTEEIDGPGGWLGRSLGPQTLELTGPCWPENWYRLPYGPVIDIEGITYLDGDGVEQTLDTWSLSDGYLSLYSTGAALPALADDPAAVRIQYQAGYDDDTTPAVPERARQAIILSVQHMKSLAVENLYVRAVDVDQVERREFTLSEAASKVVERACNSLLSTLRVYS